MELLTLGKLASVYLYTYVSYVIKQVNFWRTSLLLQVIYSGKLATLLSFTSKNLPLFSAVALSPY